MGSRQSHGTTADDRDPVEKFLLPASFIHVDGTLRLGPVLLGQETFQSANRDGPVDFTTAAGGLARMRADSSANAGQRVGLARQAVGLFEPSFCDQADVTSGVGVRRAGHHAGKVSVQPIRIDLLVFESLQHCGTIGPRVQGSTRLHSCISAKKSTEERTGERSHVRPLSFPADLLVTYSG